MTKMFVRDTFSENPRAAAIPTVSDRQCVVAFHLAIVDALRVSREAGGAEVMVYQLGPGQYFDAVNAPAGAQVLMHVRAPLRSIAEARRAAGR